jgi:hypothetical protein
MVLTSSENRVAIQSYENRSAISKAMPILADPLVRNAAPVVPLRVAHNRGLPNLSPNRRRRPKKVAQKRS